MSKKIKIIAGPCSIDYANVDDIYKLAEIKVSGKKAVFGTRAVGLKSRTSFNKNGDGMGIDFDRFELNMENFFKGANIDDLQLLPSIKIAAQIVENTGLLVASEIMSPLMQLPLFERVIPKKKLMAWSPAVSQLGWPIRSMSYFVEKNNWFLGIKNGKWVGDSGSKTWQGLGSYSLSKNIFFIHRGFDLINKGNFRNLPKHDLVKKAKSNNKGIFFLDPSHICGEKMRDQIVDFTVASMKLKDNKGDYLYEGILIEVGSSQTDSGQHIGIDEFKELVYRLNEFREIESPT